MGTVVTDSHCYQTLIHLYVHTLSWTALTANETVVGHWLKNNKLLIIELVSDLRR